jgi:hypothetical protein
VVDGPLVAVDGPHHRLDDAIEELLSLLGIEALDDLGRALDVGEEHGDLLAFSFESGPRRENLFGEILGRVALKRGSCRSRLCRLIS